MRLITGKTVEQAIGRLVNGAVDVPAAYLEGWAQRKRNDTLAERQITAAIAAKAKVLAGDNEDLAQAAVRRYAAKLVARQKSVDDVANRTLTILDEGGELPADALPPNEDFMRMFEDMAERATTEGITDLLARVLAGEVRKPGSVSRRTLQVVSVMDQEIIHAVEYLRLRMFDPNWTFVPDSDGEFDKLADLAESVSIIRRTDVVWLRPDEQKELRFPMGSRSLITVSENDSAISVPAVQFTPIGREIVALLPPTAETRYTELALGLKLLLFVKQVDICDLDARDGQQFEINRKTLI